MLPDAADRGKIKTERGAGSMTESERLSMVKAMTGETDMDMLSAYLSIAGEKICRYAYPFERVVSVPEQYHHLQVEAAVYLINKRGAEGQTSHSENGISRGYESADLPDSMLREIVPKAGAV